MIMQRKAIIGTKEPTSSIPEISHKNSVRRLIQKQGEKILSRDGVIIYGVWISNWIY
jgi:hypothetical protein